MDKIGMGVIGLGGISETHIKGILESQDAKLVALCDIDKNVLSEKAEKYKIHSSRCYKRYEDLLKCEEVDAVSICTPNDSHIEIAMYAIREKKAVAIEKPMSHNLYEAEQVMNLSKATNVVAMICFSYRYKAAIRYAKHLIETGVLGRIYHVNIQYLQSWGKSETLPLEWRFKKSIAGSGAHGDLGSHMLDITRFLVGDIVKVCAQAGTYISKRKSNGRGNLGLVDVDDYCNYMAELENGISATYNITRFAYGRGNYQKIEVYGSEGGLVYTLDEYGLMKDILEVCIGNVYDQSKVYQKVTIPDQFKADQMQSFFDMINEKGDGLSATIIDGYINQQILDAITKSYEEEKWVVMKGNYEYER